MNLLIDLLPETINIDGQEYEINTDFRIGILFELLMQDRAILDDEKIQIALNLYYPETPHDIAQAVEAMLWFYSCGKDRQESEEDKAVGNRRVDAIYSFEYDADYIYAAFLDQYHIDLQDAEHLHWWKFRAMFKSLKEDCLMSKIMGYRAMTISEDLSANEKKYYRKMKKIYALPDDRTQEEKERDFNSSLSGMF